MKREEMLAKMREAGGFGQSQLHMRSETIQTANRVKRIPRLKKALKKKSKLLVIADLALPFNPETGKEDETFNVDNKFRPPYSATSVALMLKESANENEVLKEALMRRAGVSEWDTSDVEHFTKEDWKIFGKYRVPRIFTVPVVHVNIPAMTRTEFGKDYSIEVKYDDAGEIIGEVPGVLKVNKLFRDKIYEEIQEYQKKIDSGELKETEKQQKEHKSDIYKKNPVSDVQPSNWITAIELSLTANYKLSGETDYAGFSVDVVKQALVISRMSKTIKDSLACYADGSWEKFDKNFDFYELDMNCPAEGDDSTDQGKMLIGKDTKFEKPTNTMDECLSEEEIAKVSDALTEYLDNCCENIEEEVRRSMFTPPYTEDVENQIFMSLPTVLDLNNDRYITQKVLQANREVINLAFAGTGAALLDELDAGISDRAEGDLEEAGAADAAKTYSLESADFQDASSDFDVDLVDSAAEGLE